MIAQKKHSRIQLDSKSEGAVPTMIKYANNFFKTCPAHKRAEFRKMIKSGTAYLECAEDRSQYLIVIDPGRKDEAVFACLSEMGKVTCIGNRAR